MSSTLTSPMPSLRTLGSIDRQIADHDPGECLRMHQRGTPPPGVAAGERFDLADELVQIIIRQAVREDVGVGAGHFAEVSLLPGRRAPVCPWPSRISSSVGWREPIELAQLLEHLLHRLGGLVGLHQRRW